MKKNKKNQENSRKTKKNKGKIKNEFFWPCTKCDKQTEFFLFFESYKKKEKILINYSTNFV